MNSRRLLVLLVCVFTIISLLFLGTSCKRVGDESQNKASEIEQEAIFVVGFSQLGSESSWRIRNTVSIKEAAEEAGVQLMYDNAQQKQENQIKALRSFIVYQVDVISFAPIVSTGWDHVLKEAKLAGIPVIVVDRKIITEEPNLYAGFIGTDSLEEGRKAARFLIKKYANEDGPIRIIELTGTIGSSPAIGRAQGFREVLGNYPKFSIIDSVSGDFLRSKGKEMMEVLIQQNETFDVLYSHNDGMTLGALSVLDEYGIVPGKDVAIITIDAEQAAIEELRAGRVNCVIECNPDQGPDLITMAKKLATGESVPSFIHVQESVFTEFDDPSKLPDRLY